MITFARMLASSILFGVAGALYILLLKNMMSYNFFELAGVMSGGVLAVISAFGVWFVEPKKRI